MQFAKDDEVVSPGFTPRPSLSDCRRTDQYRPPLVSPGFTPRPSLSGLVLVRQIGRAQVSPGFTPRPSLSGPCAAAWPRLPTRVAGVHAPAFVERTRGRPGGGCGASCRRGSRPGLR